MRALPLAGLFALSIAAAGPARASALPDPRADLAGFLGAAVAALCTAQDLDPDAAAWRLGQALLIEEREFEIRGRIGRWQRRYQLLSGDEVRLVRHFPGGRLRRFSLDYSEVTPAGLARPRATAIAGGDCAPFAGRRIVYDGEGRQTALEILDADFAPTGETEPLNPPLPEAPPGADGAVRVALFDSGLNYTLPIFAGRLARGPDGKALGYDFWDLDARPFDAHPVASPFFPLRHGTPVASLLAREAPEAALIPFRYPRPDMSRMADMVAAAEAAGAVVVSMPMGSNRRRDWRAFAAAASARPHMLFVISAGNNGRNIDAQPVYPAALPNENFLVVTSSDGFGRLAPESNWGPESVDVMLPAEGLTVIDFHGAEGRGSGSSYAVPRVAALAARLLAANPDWRAPSLKRAILARAVAPPMHDEPVVRAGWIANPAED